jgi:ABC-2 type transport system permease protein
MKDATQGGALRRARRGFKPYVQITVNSLMSSLAYRWHFFFSLAGTVIYLIVARFLWKAVYASGGSIAGLSFGQAYLYVAVSMGLAGLTRTGSDWSLFNIFSSGDIVRYLARPQSLSGQLVADGAGTGIMNLITITLPSLAVAGLLSGMPFPGMARVLLFIPSVLMCFLLYFYFDFLTGLSVFVTQSIGGMSIAKDTTLMILSGGLVPLAFFPAGARAVLEWLPFQALFNAPVSLLVGPLPNMAQAGFILGRQAVWLFIFFALTQALYDRALKRLVVNGG